MAYSPTTWVDFPNLSTPVDAVNLNHIETGLAAADVIARAAIAKAVATTAGDILYATGGGVVTRLGVGAAGTVLHGGASAPSYLYPPGYELAYTQKTSDTSIAATTSAASDTVVTASAVTFDGSTTAILEFWCPFVVRGTTTINVQFFDGSTAIGGAIGITGTVSPLTIRTRITPSAAAKTYSVRAFVDAGTGTVKGGNAAAGANLPCFIRIVKA